MLKFDKLIKFIGIKDDGGVPAITYTIDGKRTKARFPEYRDKSVEILKFIHSIYLRGQEDFQCLSELSELLNCNAELNFYQKVILKKQSSNVEVTKKDIVDINTFILISDTGAGKSYFLSKLLSNILEEHIDGITFEDIRRIISGNKETTKCAIKFSFNNKFNDEDKNKLLITYDHKDKTEIKWVCQEIVLEGFNKFIKQKQCGKVFNNIVPKQCLQATFKLEKVISSETLKEINDFLIKTYEGLGTVRSELKSEEIDSFSNQVFDMIYPKFNESLLKDKKLDISTENLLTELKIIKEKFSFINKATITFNIKCPKSFEILDTIGINHGASTSNILDIRLKRISSMLVENRHANIIFVMDSTDLTRLTLEPIELLKQYGRFNTTKFILSKTDILSEDEFKNIDMLLDEKIEDNDLLDEDILDYIRKNVYLSSDERAIEEIINTDITVIDNINNEVGFNVMNPKISFRDCNVEVNKFKEYILEQFTHTHWATFESYIRKVTAGKDSHIDKYGTEYSISNTIRDIFTTTYKNQELTGDLEKRLNKSISSLELDEMKKKFWSALTKNSYIYFIDKNKSALQGIYDLRKNRDVTIKYKNSMTKDRIIIFKGLYNFDPIDLNYIFKELIEASLSIAISGE